VGFRGIGGVVVLKRGLIFTLDAMAAFLLLLSLAALLMVTAGSTVSQSLSHESFHSLAQDSVSVISKMSLYDVRRDDFVKQLFDNGTFAQEDENMTVMEAIGSLWAQNDTANATLARQLAQRVFSQSIPSHLQWAIAFEGEIIYNTTELSATRSVAASRRIVSGVNRSQPSHGCIARAFLQKIKGKNEKAYAFFGGFTGQGNLTVALRGIPADAVFKGLDIELNAGDNFTVYVNGGECQTLYRSGSNYSVNAWSVTDASCMARFVAGAAENNVSLNFTGGDALKKYVGGGFVAAVYETEQLAPQQSSTAREYLPGVYGLANHYASFYVPGALTSISATLHFFNNYTTYFRVGNKTLMWNDGNESDQTVQIPDANFTAQFTRAELSSKTVPIRFEVWANATGQTGNADIVLITDVSGSMNWQMGSDSTGTVRACTDPNIYASTTQRLSVAKCVDKDFVQAILEGVGNKIALVSFSSGVANWTDFTNSSAYLNNTIGNYTQGGATCIACAINQARLLLANSNPNRTRYVIVMSDGVPNVRSVPTCGADFRAVSMFGADQGFATGTSGLVYRWDGAEWEYTAPPFASYDLYGVSNTLASTAFAVGEGGKIYRWGGSSWSQDADTGSSTHYAVDLVSPSLAFAAGSSGVYRWNGASWSSNYSSAQTLYGVDALNSSWAFAVGSSGKIFKWGGSSWSQDADTGNSVHYAVKIYNGTLAFAVGSSGKIFKWGGSSWSQDIDTGSNTFYAVDVYNGTLAFAAGSSGKIYKWNGASWAQQASPTSDAIRGLSFAGGAYAKAVTSGGEILAWNGASWSVEWQYQCDNGNLTDGASCSDGDSCWLSTSCAARNANYSSCWARQEYNATVNAIGFGPVASCAFAASTLNAIAECGNGTYFASTNASQLADYYRSLARTIVQASNASQLLSVSGSINSTLYPDSFIEYSFVPEESVFEYGDISVTVENPPFQSCNGSVFVPEQISVDEAKVTSYSADKWTDLLRLSNAATGGWLTVFNLSEYGASYLSLGDPFVVQFNASKLVSGEYNDFSVRTGSDSQNSGTECPSANRLIYRGRLRAQVNYSGIFPQCLSRNATVYYDLDFDGVADGSVNISVGAPGLPYASDGFVTVDQLNTSTNGVDNAFQRLLDKLNFMNENPSAPSGSASNPIDLKVGDEINSTVIVGEGVPYMWGPAEVSVMVWT